MSEPLDFYNKLEISDNFIPFELKKNFNSWIIESKIKIDDVDTLLNKFHYIGENNIGKNKGIEVGNYQICVWYENGLNMFIYEHMKRLEEFKNLDSEEKNREKIINLISELMNDISKAVNIDISVLKRIVILATKTKYIDLEPYLSEEIQIL